MNAKSLMEQVIAKEAAALTAIKVTDDFEQALNALMNCSGKVLTTGMGKAGHMARKFAATLCSTGTPASFLHPGEASHGDLGLIGERDCCVAFSTSGKTVEVVELLELGRRMGLETVIGITSHSDSKLRELSDIVLNMGDVEEACPLGLTPSSSIAVMLAISDALALTLLQLKGFTREDFGRRHHGGYLGMRARVDNTQGSPSSLST